MTKRLDRILKILSEQHKVTVIELAEDLKVSPATVRQDLTVLEQEGLLVRNHGGAELRETDDLAHRMAINYDEKLKIARKAVELVDEGDTIFVESGSTNAIFVKELTATKRVTIITSNAFIARKVDSSRGGSVILIGGVFQRESESIVGNMAKANIDQVNFNRAFLGVDGFTLETGFTGRDMMRAEIVNYIVSKAREVYILTDSTKFGQIHLSRCCRLEDVDKIITDGNLSDAYKAALADKVELILI
jgi:DeoR/GlpR family transcriptional regulator of sugar metabolism